MSLNILPGRHNLRSVQLSINGVPISGYSEDGGIEFEYASPELVTATYGADGHVAVSVNNNDAMICRISLLQTTRAYGLVYGLYQAQRLALKLSPVIPPTPFLMVAPNGDKVDDPFAIFMEIPAPNQSAVAGERVFSLLLPSARSRIVLGVGNLL